MNDLQAKVANHYAEQARLAEIATIERETTTRLMRLRVECRCIRLGGWLEPLCITNGERAGFDQALRYLDLRGLIDRDGERVRFKDGA